MMPGPRSAIWLVPAVGFEAVTWVSGGLDGAVEDAVAGADAGGGVCGQFGPGCFEILRRADGLLVVEPLAGERIDECAARIAFHRVAYQPGFDRNVVIEHLARQHECVLCRHGGALRQMRRT